MDEKNKYKQEFDKDTESDIRRKLSFYKIQYRRVNGHAPDEKLLNKEREKIIKKYYADDKEGLHQSEKEDGQMRCLIELLRSEQYHLSIEEMSQHLVSAGFIRGSSVKTIYKRILPALIERGAKKDTEGKWYILDYRANPEFEKRIEETYTEYTKIASSLSNFLEILKGSPFYDKAKDYVENDLKRYQRKKRKNEYDDESEEELYISRVIFLGAPAAKVNNDLWCQIHSAMDDNRIIKISYIAEGHSEPANFRVKPFQLIFDNGFWELWGDSLSSEHKGTRLFNLSRITEIDTSNAFGTFELPEIYDFRSTLAGCFGCYNDNIVEDYSIKIKKDSYAYLYIKDRIWGEFQELKETEDGYILEFEASQYKPILRWILGWGADVEPLEPQKLVDEWKETILKMSKNI